MPNESDITVTCPYCGNPAEWVENSAVYGRRYGNSYMMWLCKPCQAWVGCHKNTKKPLGTLANAELRNWRTRTHGLIDPYWRSGYMARQEVYKVLSKHFEKQIHVGEADVQTCKAIIEFVSGGGLDGYED